MMASASALFGQSPAISDGFDPNVNGVINAIAVQANGQIVFGGGFTTVQPNEALTPTARNDIARVNPDGSVDTSFDPHANNQIFAIAIQGDGKILIGGNFTTLQPNGSAPITRNHIARLNTDGSVDASFNPNAQGTLVAEVFAIAVQANGQIVIGGAFTTLQPPNASSPINQPNLARLNADGTVDTSFAPDPLATITAIGIEPTGQIVIGGAFTGIAYKGTLLGRNHIARFNADGSFDFGFDPNCNGTVNCIAFQQDGEILIGGNFTFLQPDGVATAVTRNNFARLNPDGTLDPNFAPNPSSTVSCMAVQRDDKIVIGGNFFQIFPQGSASGSQVNHVARINSDGTVDTLFDPSTNGSVQALALQNDGKILIGGNFTQVFANAAIATSTRNNLARVNPDGTLDATFNPDSSGRVLTMARQADGKILLGGNFTSFGGVTTANIARMTAAGVLDSSFAPRINGPINSFAIQANGQIVIGGSFTDINGVNRSNVARLNADGSLDLSYNPNPNGPVTQVAIQADGKILISGSFSDLQPNGSSTADFVSNFARLNTDGTVDPNINLEADSRVNAIAVQPDGKFIVGGEFTHVTPNNLGAAPNNGTVTYNRNFLARFNSDGSLDTAWDPDVNNSVNALAIDPQGRCLVGGAFTQVAPNEVLTALNLQRLIRINNDGSADLTFNPDPNQSVTGIAVQPDGHVLAVGNFSTLTPTAGAGIFGRNFLARINNDGSLDQNFNPQANGNVNSVLVLPDGSFYVGGGFTAIAGTLTTHLALFTPAATINTSFLPQATGIAGNTVNAIAVQPDGKVVIAGNFNAVSGATSTNVARFNSDSSPDFSFNSNTDGTVNAIAVLQNGSTPASPQDPNFAWIAATGGLRSSFSGDTIAQINGTVDAAVVQSDGSVIVAGNFRNNSGVTSNNILRLTPSGKLDSTYNPDPNNLISDIVLQPDGKLIIVGSFTTLQPSGQTSATTRNYIARLNTDGSVDSSFDPNASAPIAVATLQPDGKILIGGSFGSIDPNESATVWVREQIARLNTDGTVDQNFNPNAAGNGVDAIALQPNGQILVGGSFFSFQPNGTGDNITRDFLARLNADGTLDMGFDPEPNGVISAIAVQSDGKIVFGGSFSSIQPDLGTTIVTRNNIARVNADGSIDNSYDPNANGAVVVLAPGPNGELYAGGSFLTLTANGALLPTTRENLALIRSDGTVDPSFDPAPNGTIDTIQVQPDGSLVIGGAFTQLQPTGAIYIGGSFAHVSTVPAANLSLLNADGSPNTNFTAVPNGTVNALALQANGQVVVGGSFSSVGGTGRNGAARLNADNTLDAGFNPNVNGTVNTATLQANGQILIGGSFSSVGGTGHTNLARLNADGSVDGSFTPAVNGAVNAVAVQANGQVVVGGSFSSAAGAGRNNLARLNSDGSIDASFNPNPNGAVSALVLQANGQIAVAGSFTQMGSAAAVSIGRLNADGSVDSSFSANSDGTVNALALEPDGKLFLGGTFSHVDGLSRFRFARLGATTGATQSLTVNSGFNAITWSRGGSAPELSQVAFQLSTDNVNWTSLGSASRSGGSWQLSTSSLPTGTLFYLRTIGVAPSSGFASSSLVETVGSFDSATPFLGSAVSETAGSSTSSSGAKTASVITFGAVKSGSGAGSSDNADASGQDAANARLIAFTSRADVTAANPIVSTFSISGTAPKTVLVRAIGPGLSAFGVANPMANPILELYDGAGDLIVVNAGWGGSSTLSALATQVGAFPLMIGSADAAVSETLAPGTYTLRVTGANGQDGAALAEIYDADAILTTPQQIASVSSLAQVTAGNSLVGGFVVANGTRTVLIRAVGPGLSGSGSLAAPVLNVFDAQGNLLASNTGWTAPHTVNAAYPAASATAISTAAASAGAAPLADGSADAAIVAALPPGAYAVEVTTADGQSGQARIEIYKF